MFHFIEAFTHVMIIFIFFKILTKTGQDLHKKFRTDQHFLMSIGDTHHSTCKLPNKI